MAIESLQVFELDGAFRQRLHALRAGLHQVDAASLLGAAWHMRQRDPPHALAILDEWDRRSAGAPPAGDLHGLHGASAARAQLIRAEIAWLDGDLAGAETAAAQALAAFGRCDDALGSGDCHWLRAHLAVDQGNPKQRGAEIDQAVASFQRAGDPQRVRMAQARGIYLNAFTDAPQSRRAMQSLGATSLADDPLIVAWWESALGALAGAESDFGKAARHHERAFASSKVSGQIRQSIVSATNTSAAFLSLNDLSSALEWAERGLAIARKMGWPLLVGDALARMGQILQRLGHFDAARVHLLEAWNALSAVEGSGSHAAVLKALGEVSIALEDHAGALDWFTRAERQYRSLGWKELHAEALRGQAEALMLRGDSGRSLSAIEECLSLCEAQGYRIQHVEALQAAAELHRRAALPARAGTEASNAPMHFLQRALAIAEGIEGYHVPPGLLGAIAREFARSGDFEKAFRAIERATEMRRVIASRDVANRAVALHVRQETVRIRAEMDYHQQLAATEAKRAEDLQSANATLEDLGVIGREITGCLGAEEVFAALKRHVHRLLDATHFAIYLLDADAQSLIGTFVEEDGRRLPSRRVELDHPSKLLAQCVRENREILLLRQPDDQLAIQNAIPGTQPSLSLMFAPLTAGQKLLGAMTIQSPRANAYADRESAIFRTLCAYGAIALANVRALAAAEKERNVAEKARGETARALQDLRNAQEELLEKNRELERLSTTDRLTALANRLKLDDALQAELYRCERSRGQFAVLLIDLDHFKRINDSYGHPVGDAVLCRVAQIIRDNVRKTDIAGRWGGEEFLVVCMDTSAEAARHVAEKMRTAIENQVSPQAWTCTASFGVASYRPGDSVQALIARSDAALYAAKAGGRNQVSTA